jgi:hypothetical protein
LKPEKRLKCPLVICDVQTFEKVIICKKNEEKRDLKPVTVLRKNSDMFTLQMKHLKTRGITANAFKLVTCQSSRM